MEELTEIISKAKPSENLKKVLAPHFIFGTAVLEHLLLKKDLSGNMKVGRDFKMEEHAEIVIQIFKEAKNELEMEDKKGNYQK